MPLVPTEADVADRAARSQRGLLFRCPPTSRVATRRLRGHTRFDRQLLGKLSSCAWTCLKAEAQRLLGRESVVPGMIAAIQTHGELLHWHLHIHVLTTRVAFTAKGDFPQLPEFDMERLLVNWQEAVCALYWPRRRSIRKSTRTRGVGHTAVSVSISRCSRQQVNKRASSVRFSK